MKREPAPYFEVLRGAKHGQLILFVSMNDSELYGQKPVPFVIGKSGIRHRPATPRAPSPQFSEGLKAKPPGLTSRRFRILECFSNLSLCSYDLRNRFNIISLKDIAKVGIKLMYVKNIYPFFSKKHANVYETPCVLLQNKIKKADGPTPFYNLFRIFAPII